ncbi:MAG: hypothetical protein EPN30_00825 [Actinomycetota bacterium]|nr:MAG: hypothetical protein EPN30_00825 [Actinomycetota bacterium]
MMISLDLKNRKVMVIGSGSEAVSRSKALSLEGAKVTLVSTSDPSLGTRLEGVNFSYQSRLRTRNLKGVFLVIATDRDRAINEWLFKRSRKFGFLLNTLDEKPSSNFFHVAVRRINPLVEIAVSTNGASPAFASRLSTRLANQVEAEDIAVLNAFIATRHQLKTHGQSTFDFDWTGLENRIRSGRTIEAESTRPDSQFGQAPSFGVEFAPGVEPGGHETWPITPFTNNLLNIRLAKSKS